MDPTNTQDAVKNAWENYVKKKKLNPDADQSLDDDDDSSDDSK